MFGALSTEILARDRGLGAGGANKKARDLIEKAWKSFDTKIAIVSGKEVFSRLSKWSQDEYNVSINALLVTRNMKSHEIPKEFVRGGCNRKSGGGISKEIKDSYYLTTV